MRTRALLALSTLTALLLPVASHAGGLVKLSQSGSGILKITGDNAPNRISILQNAGSTHVYGLIDHAGPTELKLGNTTDTDFQFDGVTGILAKLKGGDDALDLDGTDIDPIDLAGSVKIDSGNDDDAVWVRTTAIGRNLQIKTGKGRDRVYLIGVGVSGKPSVRAGHDDDQVLIDDVTSPTFDVKLEKGDDDLCLLNNTIAADVAADGGKGISWIDVIHDPLMAADAVEFEIKGDCWT